MWLRSFRFKNFRPFKDTGVHALARHMNIVVGQNNTGKTALLRAIGDTRITGAPHLNSNRSRGEAIPPLSEGTVEVSCSAAELINLVKLDNGVVYLPVSDAWARNPARLSDRIFGLQEIVGRGLLRAAGSNGFGVNPVSRPSVKYNNEELSSFSVHLHRQDNGELAPLAANQNNNDNAGPFIVERARRKTYYFDAVRVPLGTAPHGQNTRLAPNAENLPEVLINLQHSPTAYRRYLDKVRTVLPAVRHVSVKPASSSHNQIFVWNVDESTERDDLAIPLSECGTGIGQVLAILYVVMHSSGDIIVIDEPNSFLHPSASRELISILRNDSAHQYIISTHSPEVLVAGDPEKLFMLKREGEESVVVELDHGQILAARQILEELGAKLSDTFGIDRAVWVEGPTEIQCFPLLLTLKGKRLLTGVSFLQLRSTGDLEGRHAVALADIYRNLSKSNSLVPANEAIILDGDKADNKRIKEVQSAFGAEIQFLTRRTFENFLLHPSSITALLNSLPSFQANPVAESAVKDKIIEIGTESHLGSPRDEPFSPKWLASVNAPVLLDEVFQALSDSKEIFRKPAHSVALTRWLIEHDPDFLAPIVEEVAAAVGEATQKI